MHPERRPSLPEGRIFDMPESLAIVAWDISAGQIKLL